MKAVADGAVTCAGTNTIAALLAGAADAAAAARLEEHLDRCAACRRLVAELGRGLSAIGEAPARAPERLPQPGERIGRYEIRRVIGVGGMGVVYEAHDATLDRPVAVKLLRPDLLEGPSLLAEAQAMARLAHPNIVGVFDAGLANGQLYVCMEYVAGATLRAWTAARPRGWREVVAVYAAAGEGLAYVHRAGLVHLDFKPDNVLVDDDGRVRVTDFGLARMLDARPAHGARLLVGTPAYMAPEQRRCETPDARSDQYAFCASLREALGDRRAPAWLHRVLARGLAADRADRFASMPALLAALTAPLARRRRRWGGLVATVAASALAIALTTPRTAAPRTRVVERATPVVVDRPVPLVVPGPTATPARGELASAPAARPAGAAATAASPTPARRDFTPVFAALAHVAVRAPLLHARADAVPASRPAADEPPPASGDAGGFVTELGPCDDGSLRACTLAPPACPGDTLLAVQGGCWTCADAQTCAPLGLPRTCDDGTPLSCTRAPPACEGRQIAAVRAGCWSCEDPFTCRAWSTPTKSGPRLPRCGNRTCERGETLASCPFDCRPRDTGSGSSGGSGSGGGGVCGNGFCEIGEDHATCASDCCETTGSGACAAACGNGFCEAGEDHATCASDCCEVGPSGACLPVCGNGFCEQDETGCPADCG